MASDDVEEGIVVSLEGDKEAIHGAIERNNFLNMTKLTVKSLIESSMRFGRTLTDDHPQLQQLLIVVEHILKHRLKVKRTILGQRKSFFGMIEVFEKISPDFAESVSSVRGIPGIKSVVGRGRAWLRFVLMQKKLADHFRFMVEHRGNLWEWYEPGAVMLCEESTVISGLLVGLNAIDYNVMMKGEDFDRSVGVLDFSQYLKDGNYLGKPNSDDSMTEEDQESELGKLLDQKAYLEELNRKLESQVERLQSKLQSEETMNSALSETVVSLEAQLTQMGRERDELRSMTESSSAQLRKALETIHDDQKAELDTHIQAKSGLSELYASTQKTLEVEMKLRQQVEQELELQRSIREEKETALQLLEKSTHEKQNTIVGLRKQLEEMKAANLKMQGQLKSSKETHRKDSLKIRDLESKLSKLTADYQHSEKEFHDITTTLRETEMTAKELGSKLEEVQLGRSSAESDLAIEKQWRMSLQTELQKEKDRVVELTNQTKKFKSLRKEHAEVQEKYACLQETVSEQEIALVEMGKQLSLSQQRVVDMKEETTVIKESVWVEDKEVSLCRQCEKPFSVARRRHHCRSCGGIFCFACSENSMQLPSSSKPVRVCDSCYSMILERSSS